MFRRLFNALAMPGREQAATPIRPNQLRRDDAIAERRRQEAVRRPARPAPPTAQSRSIPPATQPSRRETPASLRAALSSRAGMRQAMLLQEVLGPPLSLRDQDSTRSHF